MSRNRKWKIWCIDEKNYIETIQTDSPAECPNNASHRIHPSGFGVHLSPEIPDRVLLFNNNGVIETDTTHSPETSIGLKIQSLVKTNLLFDEKPSGSQGGTFNDSVWQVRDLNTAQSSDADIFLNNDNTFTLQTGSYDITASVPAFKVDNHIARLRDVSDVISPQYGTTMNTPKNRDGMNTSIIDTKINVSLPSTFRIEHRCSRRGNNDGFGSAIGINGIKERYTTVKIRKLS